MRAHGTHACYVFGPESGGDTSRGCRCAECKAAASAYERERKRREVPPYVAAGPARAHVAWLSTQGVGLKQVAEMSGVSQGALWKLMYGKRRPDGTQVPSKRIRPETAAAVLAVSPSGGAGGSRVPAGPVWEDIDRLLARGWTKRAIAQAIANGVNGLQIGRQVVTRRQAKAIHALLDRPVPATVGRAWSAQHQAHAPADEPAPSAEDILRDQARRADLANRQRRARMGDDYEPVTYDNIDVLLIEMAEALEARIDQAAWRRSAACKGKPAWLFFPARGDVETNRAAKAVCATCPVSAQCLAANLDQREGIIGGTSEKERRALRREVAA